MEKRQVEILAPAGSYESMKAAVAAGADAVYMGGSRFGARAYADNPDEKGLLEAIDYVHLHGRRLYMTVNTLFKEGELAELEGYMRPYYERGLDAVIVQDLGAMAFMKEHFPGLELHASTQMTITSVYGARMMKGLGCSRVVTAREMSLDEIRRIRQEVDIEIESFVHGALCYCYSGQCLMSSLIGGRSGNRGRCAQPCRLPYSVYGEKAGQPRPAALNRDSEKHVLSLKDLCTLDILPDIIEAGVYSLKIEGRMKSPRYTAGVVSIYRRYVDLYEKKGREGYHVEPEHRKMLLDLFDRGGFTDGYYTQHNGRDMAALKEKPEFREGNQKLFDYLDKTYVEAELKESVCGHVELEEGMPCRLILECRDVRAEVLGQAPQAAQNQPMTQEKVLKQLKKTGGTPFQFEHLTADIKGNLFLPVQALNELRREGFQALENALLDPGRRGPAVRGGMAFPGDRIPLSETQHTEVADTAPNHPVLTVYLEELSQLQPVLDRSEISQVYLDADGFEPAVWKSCADRCHQSGKQCWIALPHIFRTHAQIFLKTNRNHLAQAGFDGVLVRALEEVEWLREAGLSLPYGLDASVYTWNSTTAAAMAAAGASSVTMPWELNNRELEPVMDSCRRLRLPGELIIYGHAPMMVSAQCMAKTVKGCTRRREVLMMKDRTGAMLPVKNHCSFCYNTVYNPTPVSLLGNEKLVRRLRPERLRLQFTIEGREQTGKVLDAFIRSFMNDESVEAPFKDFTRGHFKRGVE